ncbi:MAG: polyprenyl synthetase family protein [Candidatus Daviesbacteria bacterium]|nr:MAG: polyprenyl synthetase family protein [Candidatus Daviesbacteria bacterium]
MDFTSYLKEAAGEINSYLISFFNNWLAEVTDISPTLLPLAKTLSDNCGGGKMLRGSLVKLGYELAGGKNLTEILKPAVAVEIFQTAILAHDDIIDQSPLRRGKPTIYKQLGGDHYGISQTIALADIGFFLSVKLIAESNFDKDKKNKALSHFAQTVINTGLGEVLDVELPHIKEDRVDKDVITIHKLKTSYYTIIDPLTLGAILGGAQEETLKVIAKFGENLGIAFQITDDILGVFGDEKTLGKSVTSDIEEGKNTLLITYALQQATGAQKQVLDRYYGQGKIGEKELEIVRAVFKETGSLDNSRQEALKYVTQAKAVIPKITQESKYSQLLSQMADFLVERDR